MLRKLSFLLMLIFLAGCACNNKPASDTVGATLRAQEQSNWCWAASGEMIMDFHGVDVSQCQEANQRFNRTDCCTNPGACNMGGWPQFDVYGFTFDVTSDAALTWAQIREQIFCKNSPIAFSWHWPGGGGHMMVIYGYSTANNVNNVEVHDPWPPNVGNTTFFTYDYYVSSAGHHTHWNDYYNIKRTSGG